jgi:hypothetical protein
MDIINMSGNNKWEQRQFIIGVISIIIALATLIATIPRDSTSQGTATDLKTITPTKTAANAPTDTSTETKVDTSTETKVDTSTETKANTSTEAKAENHDSQWISTYSKDASTVISDANNLDTAIYYNYNSIYTYAKLLSEDSNKATTNSYFYFVSTDLTNAESEHTLAMKQANLWAKHIINWLDESNEGDNAAARDEAKQAIQCRNSFYQHAKKASELVTNYNNGKSFKYMS